MTTELQFIDPAADRWVAAPADQAAPVPAAHTLLTFAQWQAVRAGWPADLPVGVAFANDADIETLAEDLPRLALVALHFPKWVDGRAYSQARLLRARYRFRGEVRATGDVTVDIALQLRRTGFDSAVLRAGLKVETARRALGFFPMGHYQGDVHEPRPLFARPPVPARLPEVA